MADRPKDPRTAQQFQRQMDHELRRAEVVEHVRSNEEKKAEAKKTEDETKRSS